MNENQEKAGVFAVICSFLIPLVGVILYFVNKNKVANPSAYLIAAGISIGMVFMRGCLEGMTQ